MTDAYLKRNCKPGTAECCRYLVCGGDGFECAKLTDMKAYLDQRVVEGTIRAVGDNCKGLPMK
jgi:hypothetical protein